MCHGITKSNQPCTRKANWCKQHLNQKPVVEEPVVEEPIVEEPIVEQKKEEPELIEAGDEIISEDILSPMSPSATSTPSPQPDYAIVEEENFKPTQKIFNARECFIIHRGDEYQYWVDKCALGKAYVSFKLRQANGDYVYETKGCRVLRVVKYDGKRTYRNYVWFYNHVDMHAFIKYFHGDQANGTFGQDQTFTYGDRWYECHELFIGKDPTIKLFLDIEKVIPNTLLKEYRLRYDCSINDFAEDVCADVMKALKGTLEEVDHRYEMYESGIDYAIVERCRAVNDEEVKISYHLITSIAMRVSECKAVVKHMKENYLSFTEDRVSGYKDMLCDASTIDVQPYRKNGSLSLPGGRKNDHQLKLIRSFNRAAETLHLNDYHDCTWMHVFSDDLPTLICIFLFLNLLGLLHFRNLLSTRC